MPFQLLSSFILLTYSVLIVPSFFSDTFWSASSIEVCCEGSSLNGIRGSKQWKRPLWVPANSFQMGRSSVFNKRSDSLIRFWYIIGMSCIPLLFQSELILTRLFKAVFLKWWGATMLGLLAGFQGSCMFFFPWLLLGVCIMFCTLYTREQYMVQQEGKVGNDSLATNSTFPRGTGKEALCTVNDIFLCFLLSATFCPLLLSCFFLGI